ncbi:MAG: TIGR01777 family protein [Acidobacteria bacterium]|nr:TIGR01777 family protein [Acidobacteriota bacterium]
MIVALSGANGFVGRHLQAAWPVTYKRIPREGPSSLEGVDCVVHLAGEPVSQRWNAEVKRRIRDSRVLGTRAVAKAIRDSKSGPKTLICASAVGYYGSRGGDWLEEAAAPGDGFLPDVCREWETEADAAGVRTVKIRIGLVLGRDGGAMKSMLLPFRLGLGASLGSGAQWMSWIHIDDLCGMIRFAAEHADAKGAWNGVSPNPVTNAEFTRELARALGRPAFFRAPEFVLRAGAGEMAQILLNSQRCRPAAALAAGYPFRYPELGPALRAVVT